MHAPHPLHGMLARPRPAAAPTLLHCAADALLFAASTAVEVDVQRAAGMGERASAQSGTWPTLSDSAASAPRVRASHSSADGSREHLAPGDALGRYRIVAHLGAGAMGVVYLAHDPELERRVAIKLLRQRSVDERDRMRLVREAQAMAKISHRNVVVVHEVDSADDRLFIVMEYIRGASLRTWLKAHHSGHAAILSIFTAVGRGLAAAHAAGVIHRDFKPDNVLVGDDGRPRVTDFGLARAVQRSDAPLRPESFARGGSAVGLAITRAGAVLGTPLYMAPEQWAGAELDARCDQFAFCAALWEAIFGESAFGGETVAARMRAVTHGELRPPTDPSRAPPWLRAALSRGLALDPDARWPTMDALLAALSRDDARRRRRRATSLAALGLGALALALAAPRALAEADAQGDARRCAAAVASLDDTWGTARAAAIVRASLPFADRGAARTRVAELRALYDDAATWRALRREACASPPSVVFTWSSEHPVIDRCFADAADDLRLRAAALAAGGDAAPTSELTGALDAARCLDDDVILGHDFDLPAEAEAAARWRGLRDRAAAALERPHPEAVRELTAAAAAARSEGFAVLDRDLRALLAARRYLAGERLQALEVVDGLLRDDARELRPPSASVRFALAGALLHGSAASPPRLAVAAELLGVDRRAELDGGLLGAYLRASADDELTRLEADARLLLLAGENARAATLARRALELSEAAPGRPAAPALRSALLLTSGRASLAQGALDDAAAALDGALALADPTLTSAARRGHVHLARAELALGRADARAAHAELAAAAALRERAARDDDLFAPELDRVRAALAAREGDDEAARAALRDARVALLSSSGFARARLAAVDRGLAALAERSGAADEAAELRVEAELVDASLRGRPVAGRD